jgi:hypothetical protein
MRRKKQKNKTGSSTITTASGVRGKTASIVFGAFDDRQTHDDVLSILDNSHCFNAYTYYQERIDHIAKVMSASDAFTADALIIDHLQFMLKTAAVIQKNASSIHPFLLQSLLEHVVNELRHTESHNTLDAITDDVELSQKQFDTIQNAIDMAKYYTARIQFLGKPECRSGKKREKVVAGEILALQYMENFSSMLADRSMTELNTSHFNSIISTHEKRYYLEIFVSSLAPLLKLTDHLEKKRHDKRQELEKLNHRDKHDLIEAIESTLYDNDN